MRTEFERRPALLLLIGLIVGLTAPTFLANLAFVLLGLVLLRGLRPRVCLSLALCIGATLAPRLPLVGITAAQDISGRFTVVSPPTRRLSGGSSFQVEAGNLRFQVESADVTPVLGDEVSVEGKLRPLPTEYERTYLSRGLTGIVTLSSAKVEVVKHTTGPMAWGTEWRESFLAFCERRLSGGDLAVVSALVFDVSTGLELPTRTALEQSGTVHILAASGIHLLLLAWFLELILVRLPLPYLVRRTIVLGLGFLFSAAGGLHPGTFRALFSLTLRDVSVIAGQSYDSLSAVGAAGIVYLLWRPTMVFDAGFQLSMVLGAGMAMFRYQTSGMPVTPRLTKGAISTWIVSLPIIGNLFGLVSFVSIPANLLAGALLPLCFLGLLASHAASFLSEGLSQVILAPSILATHGLEAIVDGFGLSRVWGFRVPPFSAYWLVPIYGVALAFWKPRERPIS